MWVARRSLPAVTGLRRAVEPPISKWKTPRSALIGAAAPRRLPERSTYPVSSVATDKGPSSYDGRWVDRGDSAEGMGMGMGRGVWGCTGMAVFFGSIP